MTIASMTKTPDEVLDYDVDFLDWLPDGDRITAAAASLVNASAGSTVAIDSTTFSDTAVKVWLSGGAADDTATVSVEATTNDGRTKEACFRIRIRECH